MFEKFEIHKFQTGVKSCVDLGWHQNINKLNKVNVFIEILFNHHKLSCNLSSFTLFSHQP